jgi:hypothetical protein
MTTKINRSAKLEGRRCIPTSPEINAMTAQQYKVLENRLRAAAKRQGLRLEKSRRRDPRAYDYGTYMLLDAATSIITCYGGQNGYGLSLDDIARALFEDFTP